MTAAPSLPLKLQAFTRRNARLLGLIVFLACLFMLARVTGLREHFDLEFVRGTLEGHPVIGAVMFVALFCLGNLIQIPGWLFLASAVLVLGPKWGAVATYAAACTSCLLTFWVVRWLGGDALRRLESPLALGMLQHLDERPIAIVIGLRFFFQTLPALNYTLALTGIRLRHYALGTALGLPLPIALYCIFFDQLATFIGLPH